MDEYFDMATTVKINIDRACLKPLSKTFETTKNKMNGASFVYGTTRSQSQTKSIEQAADFHMPNQFVDLIVLKNGSSGGQTRADFLKVCMILQSLRLESF